MNIDLAHNAEVALRMVREEPIITFDTEGSGLDWRQHSPVGYVLGAPRHGAGRGGIESGSAAIGVPVDVVYVPVRHGGGGNLSSGRPMQTPTDVIEIHPFEKALAKAFDERNSNPALGLTVGHHLKFDCHSAYNAGISLGRKLADTQNLGPILNEYERSYSLEASADRYGVQAKKGEIMYAHLAQMFGVPNKKGAMEHYWRLAGNDPVGYEYATGDGVTTMQLYYAMMEEIEKQDLQVVAKLENDLIWTLFRMERKGIRVNQDEIETLRHATEDQINKESKSIGGINTRSPIQMKALMEERGHTDWPETEKGNPSFAEKWLDTHETGRTVLSIRQKVNLLNSFVNPLRETHMYKGRIHATLNQLKGDDSGTISGRFSCSHPNLQQVPKRKKELAKPFRRLFIPDPGKLMWERDWSQCEPRLFAHYSHDPALLEGYNSIPFRDAHQVVADMLNVERDPTAKRMNMGIFTGMQVRSFAGHMGWDYDRASDAWHKWFEEFPAVKDFQNTAKRVLRSRGYVKTLLGRRCRLESARFAYKGTSKIIQGSNADIAKYKLLEMDLACEAEGDIVEVLMTVHDSFNGQREDTPEAEKLMGELVRIMEDVQSDPFNLAVPFVAEGFDGANWSEASFGK